MTIPYIYLFISFIFPLIFIFKKRFYETLFFTAFCFFFALQPLYLIVFKVNLSNRIYLGYSEFDYASFIASSFLFTSILLVYFFLPSRKLNTVVFYDREVTFFGIKKSSLKFNYNKILMLDIFFLAYIIGCILILIAFSGGLEAAVNDPGAMRGGQTLILLMIGLGKWYVISAFAATGKVSFFRIILLGLILAAYLINSRFMTLYILINMIVVQHYFVANRNNLYRYVFVGAILALLVIVVFGSYRDIVSKSHNNIVSFKMIFDFILSEEFFGWFVNQNVEGFSGVSDAIFDVYNGSGLAFVWRQLFSITQLLPYSLKTYIGLDEIAAYLNTFGSMPSSVITSGYELWTRSLGIFGFYLYSALIGYILLSVLKSLNNRRFNLTQVLVCGLLTGLRGDFFGAFIFFGVADVIGLLICKNLILNARRRKL